MSLGYSSDVQLSLIVAGREYELSQIGPTGVRLREPADLPAGEAEIVMLVDGEECRWTVILPDGAVPFERDVPTMDPSEVR